MVGCLKCASLATLDYVFWEFQVICKLMKYINYKIIEYSVYENIRLKPSHGHNCHMTV